MNKFEKQLEAYAVQVNDALKNTLQTQENLLQMAVIDAMRYSLLDAGKRIRGALVLEFGRLTGAPHDGAMALACAVEMVHAYSLVHDDLPCMDNDDMRRGKPSCHKAFGEATALLAGDGLLTLAFSTIAQAPLSDAQRISAVGELAGASGIYGMIGGQMIDLSHEGKPITMEILEQLCALKTGALLRVSARLGCIAGDASADDLEAADTFARAYGLAFQITDDILDIVGDQAKLGKPIGSDVQQQKTTYASLMGVDAARSFAAELVAQSKESAKQFGDHDFLFWLADMLLTRDR